MRLIAIFTMLVAVQAACGDEKEDRELTRLMVGIWRSPRHTYVYAADGRWWNADAYEWLDKPAGLRGHWKIQNQELLKDHEKPSVGGSWDGGLWDLKRYRITKLTHDEVVFGGYRMKRWTRQDVKNW